MARNDPGIAGYQNRVGEAELNDAGRNLRHLLGAVRPGIALIGHQPIDRPSLQLLRDHRAFRHRDLNL
jgi:hypothetical protein